MENTNNKHDQDEHKIPSNTDDNVIDQVDESHKPTCSKVNGKEQRKERLAKRPKVRGKMNKKNSIKNITEEIIDGKGTICDRKLTGVTKKIRHKYCDQTIEKPYECDVCKRKFLRESSLKTHMTVHNGTGHPCIECGRTFLYKRELQLHANKYNY